ncbi:uncharacterized protein AMSG_03863 [Thecamonas trahens ATCC 50062]|uniref:Uncharacterized protein n=1 Tax=Thecamonas trahens ATCC 50062 TaxID=461836 RepID=A0A0L0D5E2_THETB|nr:hypothetical protein AMSG_03863 [Thecamonas trahens ATCC 50062]KNC47430.1 hypothetical protein AMSG_03863 [Thecamonas trahens ATCC 50062]|eukprot:XP_013759766.1 hypothetical protein AMSG_03863 [Thecamonas trahens ATCC 50062]
MSINAGVEGEDGYYKGAGGKDEGYAGVDGGGVGGDGRLGSGRNARRGSGGRRWLSNCFRSVPYASLLAVMMAASGLSAAWHGWKRFHDQLDEYLTVDEIHKYEHWFYVAVTIPFLFDLLALVVALSGTGAIQEACCAKRGCCTRMVGKVLAALMSLVSYGLVFCFVALFSAFVSLWGFKKLFDYACDEVDSFSESTCIDLSQFGLGNKMCGPNFRAFCVDLREMNPNLVSIFSGLLLIIAAQVNVVVIHCVNYNRIRDRVNRSRSARVWREEYYAMAPEDRPLLRR